MTQSWNINGQTYTHGQLMELRKQKLDPLKDKIVMANITPRAQVEEVKVEAKKEKKVKVVKEVVEGELPSNYMQLKALAKEKGMEVTTSTKKEDVLKFLEESDKAPQV